MKTVTCRICLISGCGIIGGSHLELTHKHNLKLEKGFQKKTIVAFTNITVFILDFNI